MKITKIINLDLDLLRQILCLMKCGREFGNGKECNIKLETLSSLAGFLNYVHTFKKIH